MIYFTHQFDVSLICDRLYQGSMPPTGGYLSKCGIDAVVLCAKENQNEILYKDVCVLCAPGDDDERFDRAEKFIEQVWLPVSLTVANLVKSGMTVLVTCIAGHNRSGAVTALSLHHITGKSGRECVEIVRSRRHGSLSNETFVKIIEEMYP